MRIEAVVFDLDDTLTDWHGAVGGALAEIAPNLGFGPADVARIRDAMQRFVRVDRAGQVVDRQHWRLVESPDPWLAAGWLDPGAFVAAFREALLPRLAMHDDFSTLSELAGRHRIAILSNNPYARTALEEQGHAHLFEAVVMAEEPYRKPHPRAFEVAAAQFGCDPAGLVYVGDSIENDVEGALAAGWTPIWIDRFDDGYDLPGVSRISTLRQLPAVLDALSG